MMKKIKIDAPAKINLFLEIESKRADGYHNISSVSTLTDLKDDIMIEVLDEDKIELICDKQELQNKFNLAYRAAEIMKDKFGIKKGVKIILSKKIPWGAGLGGGSSDCAAVIIAMAKLFGISINSRKLKRIAAKLGADVPFFLSRFKTASAFGIGDKLRVISRRLRFHAIIIKPKFEISTKWAYSRIRFPLAGKRKIDKIVSLIRRGAPLNEITPEMFNRFEKIAVLKYPRIKKIKKALLEAGALNAMLTGSGSAIFAVFENKQKAKKAFETISDYYGKKYLVEV